MKRVEKLLAKTENYTVFNQVHSLDRIIDFLLGYINYLNWKPEVYTFIAIVT